MEYDGGRSSTEIISWLKKKLGIQIAQVNTLSELADVEKQGDVTIIGVFFSSESENAKKFTQLVKSLDILATVVVTYSNELRDSLGVNGDAIVIHKNFDNKHAEISLENGFIDNDISKFIFEESKPIIIEFSRAVFTNPIKQHCLLFTSSEFQTNELPQYFSGFYEAAKQSKHRDILFIHIRNLPDLKNIYNFFGVESFSTTIMFTNFSIPGDIKKYKYLNSIHKSNELISSIDDFLANKLLPFFKSEEVLSSDRLEDVVVVRGKSFEEIVLNTENDVFIEFYAPW